MQLAHALAFTQYGSAPGRAAVRCGARRPVPDARCRNPGMCVFRCRNQVICVSAARISRKSGTNMRI